MSCSESRNIQNYTRITILYTYIYILSPPFCYNEPLRFRPTIHLLLHPQRTPLATSSRRSPTTHPSLAQNIIRLSFSEVTHVYLLLLLPGILKHELLFIYTRRLQQNACKFSGLIKTSISLAFTNVTFRVHKPAALRKFSAQEKY